MNTNINNDLESGGGGGSDVSTPNASTIFDTSLSPIVARQSQRRRQIQQQQQQQHVGVSALQGTRHHDNDFDNYDDNYDDDDDPSRLLQTPLISRSNNDMTTILSPNVRQRSTAPVATTITTTTSLEESYHNDESRILDRSAAFHQSRGRWGVERLGGSERRRRRTRLQQQQQQQNQQLGDDDYCCCGGGSGCSCCCCYYYYYYCFCCFCYCCDCLYQLWKDWILGDWFHRLAYKRTCDLMLILFFIYCIIVVFFAFVYYGVSMIGQDVEVNPDGTKKIIAFCDMEINDHMEALYFSLSTMTTIGYGVSDYYFGGCWTPLLLVLWQVCSAICFTAVATGLLFQRIARGRKRGKTIAFSDKALIQRVNGIPYLMFRIGETKSYHLMEATVRCYCIRHERLPVVSTIPTTNNTNNNVDTTASNNPNNNNIQSSTSSTATTTNTPIETTYFLSRQVKLLHPDEAYGSTIWMGLPQVVVHRMDESSPLVPPSPIWYDEQGTAHSYQYLKKTSSSSPSSSPSANDNNFTTTTTTTTSQDDPLATTPNKEANNDSNNNNNNIINMNNAYISDLQEIEKFLSDREAEIVVLVEGTDEGTGSATQARHSYKLSDLVWNHTFVPCVFPYHQRHRHQQQQPQQQNRHRHRSSRRRCQQLLQCSSSRPEPVCSVDFYRFHDSVPVPPNLSASPYIPTP